MNSKVYKFGQQQIRFGDCTKVQNVSWQFKRFMGNVNIQFICEHKFKVLIDRKDCELEIK